jgi:hypothetical protein
MVKDLDIGGKLKINKIWLFSFLVLLYYCKYEFSTEVLIKFSSPVYIHPFRYNSTFNEIWKSAST